jgi:hypothetical protein
LLKHTVEPYSYTAEQNALLVYTPVARTDEMGDAHIEDYLDHATAPLLGRVSFEERQKERTRFRAELEAMIAAYQELGHARPEAVALALKSRPLLPSQTATTPTTTPQSAKKATLRAAAQMIGSFVAGYLVICAIVAVDFFINGNVSSSNNYTHTSTDAAGKVALGVFILLPMVTGFWVGFKNKALTAKQMFKACALLGAVLCVFFGLLLSSESFSSDSSNLETFVWLMALQFVPCLLSSLAAIGVRKRE